MSSSGISSIVPRGFRSDNTLDPNAWSTLKNAQSGGIANRDVYVFPCVSWGNAASQIQKTVSGLSGCPYNIIFLDV